MADKAIDKLLQKLFTNLEDHEYKDKITDLMIDKVYSLETSLFSQMDSESKRIDKIAATISRLENSLLAPKQVDKLDPGDKMALYNRLNANLHKELALLQNFQHSIPQALENIDSLDAIKSQRRKRSQQDQSKKEKEATPVTLPSEKPVHPYLKKTVKKGDGEMLGTITGIIEIRRGQFAVLFAVLRHKRGNFVVPLEALAPYDDFLLFKSREDDLMKCPSYKEGDEKDPSWIKTVRAFFAWQPPVFTPTDKPPEPIRKPDSEEGDNGNQGK